MKAPISIYLVSGADETFLFLTVGEKGGEGCRSIRLRKENNTDMQLWKLQPKIQ
jgi:hypothetical protein